MKRLTVVLTGILGSVFVAASAVPSSASVSVGISLGFHDSLAPYGHWVESGSYGSVWAPYQVDHAWRPYTRGRWAYTNADWTWVSDEQWGWATDHYGRWFFDPSQGWVWVPGEEWAPAWVTWRHGGGYVGWAPLPPGVDAFGGGFDGRVDPYAYSFIDERRMMDRSVYRNFVPTARNVTYVGLTQDATRYTRVNGGIVNQGIDHRSVERFTGHAVQRSQIREAASAAEARAGREQNGHVAFYRPQAGRPAVVPSVQVRPTARVNERPEQFAHRQGQERQRLQSTELLERGKLRQIQANEVKHPPVVREERGQPQAQNKARTHPATIDKEQLRARHDGEQKAQAEHEHREQQMLQQRHQREARTVAEAHPPQRQQAKTEKPASAPKKQSKAKDKAGKS